MDTVYVTIAGNDWSIDGGRTSDAYVHEIVYGDPAIIAERIERPSGRGFFLALLRYENQTNNARYTVDRMPSFGYSSQLYDSEADALTELSRLRMLLDPAAR